MKRRKLGWTDIEFTTVGIGTWAQGGGDWKAGWGDQDDKDSIIAIREGLNLGINWIDTAAIYGVGHSEEVLGQALKDIPKSEHPYIATKCGRVTNDTGDIIGNLKADSIKREIESSLSRIGVEVIDLYQIHWPLPDEDIEEAWTTMAEIVKEGKARYIGVSNFSVAQLERIQHIHKIASLQPPYSMLHREAEKDLLPFCGKHNIGVIAYSPMQKGLLTGKYTKEKALSLPANDHRSRDPMFQEPQIDRNIAVVEKVKEIAQRYGKTPAQVAISWVLRRAEVTAAIVGARKKGQISETAEASDWDLPNEAVQELEAALVERESKL